MDHPLEEAAGLDADVADVAVDAAADDSAAVGGPGAPIGAMDDDCADELWSRLRRLDTTSLADADTGQRLRTLPTDIRRLVPGPTMVGRAVTVRANEDLLSLIAGLRMATEGDILVVDAGGDERAVAGELFATEAQRRGMAGIVVHGRVRDTATLATMQLPVFATGVAPRAYAAVKLPEVGVEISMGGVTVRAGEVVVGDGDGVLVGAAGDFAALLETAEAIQLRERALRAAMLAGNSLFDAINYEEHVAALAAGQPSRLTFS